MFLAFKNNAPFSYSISKINNVLNGKAEDLDVLMPLYNLLKYCKNYTKKTGRFWNYYRDEPNDPLNDDDPPTVNHNADPIGNSKSFKYKSSIRGKTSDANQENGENAEQRDTKTEKHLEIFVSLKHLSNFWRTLDIPLINFEVSPTLTWSENCLLTDIIIHAAVAALGENPARPAINAPTNVTLK